MISGNFNANTFDDCPSSLSLKAVDLSEWICVALNKKSEKAKKYIDLNFIEIVL